MTSRTDELLLVVSILRGRHFPKIPDVLLVVQASFNSEQLETDPVESQVQPQFNTELGWELDRKTLHRHRYQRTPIKLQCFTVDSIKKNRESLGYLLLDLRSIQEVKQEPRWYPLIGSKTSKQKPALLLGLVLEIDTKPSKPSLDSFKAKKTPPPQKVTDFRSHPLKAVLMPEKGVYQVGPADLCTDMFILSVTLEFASKLEQLIPNSISLSTEGSEFFFSYSLLGNVITTEPFRSLLSPEFNQEQAFVRIHSNIHILHSFLSQQPNLQILLCCGKLCLGSADVSLSSLSAASLHLAKEAAILKGAFLLCPPEERSQSRKPLPVHLQPTIVVSVMLQKEQPETSKYDKEPLTPGVQSPAPDQAPTKQRPQSSSQVLKQPNCSLAATGPPLHTPSSHTESEAESLLEEFDHDKKETEKPAVELEVSAELQSQPDAAAEGAAPSLSVSAPKVAVPSSSHHFCFSLDLCTLGDLRWPHPVAASLRYSYPFFGSAAPIMTNPPVELHKNMEVSLPQSYCAFDFATLPEQLQDTFQRVPLVVEMWHKDSTRRDQLIGRASIQLSHLLSSQRCKFVGSNREQCWRQTVQERIAVVGAECPSKQVGELNYTATLEDLGLVNIREVVVSNSSQSNPPANMQPSDPPAATSVAVGVANAPLASQLSRHTLEYQTALELELWKMEQEELFDDQLRKKELSHMQELAKEWRRRDEEREALVKKKEVEYNRLEEQLQKTLVDLEKREKHLVDANMETQRLKKTLRAEHDLAMRELQESSRRLKQECDHQVALEKEERVRLLQQLKDSDSCYKRLEKEFSVYKEQQNVRPEFRLQTELNLMALEKVELERKLESTTKSKLHYKQQWGRALKELARFKQREQENALALLKKQQAELEAMKLRFLEAEGKDVIQQERKELDSITVELNRLKEQSSAGPTHSGPHPVDGGNNDAEEHLSRLLEERDTLLRTGVYTHDDRIITELNRQIRSVQEGLKDSGQL